MKAAHLLVESHVLLEGRRVERLWESVGIKLKEAALTPDQIQQIFQAAEQGATAAGGNRTLLGKGKDAAAAVNKAWEDLKTKVQTSAPIANVDSAYDSAVAKIEAGLGGPDNAINQVIQKYRKFAKEHPIAQGIIYSALIAAAGISGAGLGGAAVLGLLKMTDKLLQGEKFSSAAYSGAKTGAMAYGASKLADYMKGGDAKAAGDAQAAGGAPAPGGALHIPATADSEAHRAMYQAMQSNPNITQSELSGIYMDAIQKANPNINLDYLQTMSEKVALKTYAGIGDHTSNLAGSVGNQQFPTGGMPTDTIQQATDIAKSGATSAAQHAVKGASSASSASSAATGAATNAATEIVKGAGSSTYGYDGFTPMMKSMADKLASGVPLSQSQMDALYNFQGKLVGVANANPNIGDVTMKLGGQVLTGAEAVERANSLFGSADSLMRQSIELGASKATNESHNPYIDYQLMVMEQRFGTKLHEHTFAVHLTKEGIQQLFKNSVYLHEGAGWDAIKAGVGQIGAGIKQGVKNVAGAAAQKIATTGKNLTTKVTADKLNKAWVAAKSPTETDAVAKVMTDAGLTPEIVSQAFSAIGVAAPASAAPAAPAAAPAAAAPAGKKHTGGRVAGAGLSQTPNAIRQRAARAAKKTPAAAPAAPTATPAAPAAPAATTPAATPAPAPAATPNYGGGQQTVTPTLAQPAAPAPAPAAPKPNFAGPSGYASQKISIKQPQTQSRVHGGKYIRESSTDKLMREFSHFLNNLE